MGSCNDTQCTTTLHQIASLFPACSVGKVGAIEMVTLKNSHATVVWLFIIDLVTPLDNGPIVILHQECLDGLNS